MAFGFGVGIQRIGSIGVGTLTELEAEIPAAGIRPTGFVYADPTPANNGVWAWSGAAWARKRGLPDSIAVLTSVGGTADAITASVQPHVDAASVALVILVPVADNTDAVTLNGLPVLDAAGDPLIAGALVAGRSFLLQNRGDEYRLLNSTLGLISDISGLQAALDGKAASSVYDPQGIEGDAFDRENHTGTNTPSADTVDEPLFTPGLRGRIAGALSVLNPYAYGAAVGSDNLAALAAMFADANTRGLPVDLLGKRWKISDTLEIDWTSRARVYGDGAVIELDRAGGAAVGYGVRNNIVGGHGFDCRGWIVDAGDEAYVGLSFHGPASMADARDGIGEEIGAVNVLRSGTDFVGGFGLWFYNGFDALEIERAIVRDVRVAVGASIASSVGAHGIAVTGSAAAESRFVLITNPVVDGVYSLDTALNTDQDGILLFGIPPTATSRPDGYAKVIGGRIRNARGRGVKMARQNGHVERSHFERDGADGFSGVGLMDIDFQFGEGNVRDITYRHEVVSVGAIVSSSYQAGILSGDLTVDGVRGWIDPGMTHVPNCIAQRSYSNGGHAPGKTVVRGIEHMGRYVTSAVRYATSLDSAEEHLTVEDCHIQTLGSGLVRNEGGAGSVSRMTINRNTHGGSSALPVVSEISGVAIWSGGSNQGLAARSYVASLSGCTTVPTGTVTVARKGEFVSLAFAGIAGTSNSAAAVLNGLPVSFRPRADRLVPARVVDGSAFKDGYALISSDGSITLFPDVSLGAWAATGTKGITSVDLTYLI